MLLADIYFFSSENIEIMIKLKFKLVILTAFGSSSVKKKLKIKLTEN